MEAIGTLAGGIAHDFNNILAAIMGFASLGLKSPDASGPVGEYFEEIHRAGGRGADLVRQILAFSRQQEHRRVPLELRDVVAESVKLLKATVSDNVDFRLHLPVVSTFGCICRWMHRWSLPTRRRSIKS
jgi:signal transduction histidine kinase